MTLKFATYEIKPTVIQKRYTRDYTTLYLMIKILGSDHLYIYIYTVYIITLLVFITLYLLLYIFIFRMQYLHNYLNIFLSVFLLCIINNLKLLNAFLKPLQTLFPLFLSILILWFIRPSYCYILHNIRSYIVIWRYM